MLFLLLLDKRLVVKQLFHSLCFQELKTLKPEALYRYRAQVLFELCYQLC